MPRFTYRDRQRSVATCRRNARLRQENNPTIEMLRGVVVTKEVEKRLTKMAEAEVPKAPSLAMGEFIVSAIPILSIVTGLILFTVNLLWAAVIICVPNIVVFLVIDPRLQPLRKEWRTQVGVRVKSLAVERKNRLDETKQFYSSPEWNLIRKQIINEKGRVCSECGKRIRESNDVTVDHILPRSKYPSLALEKNNLCVLCRSCNSRKGDRDPDRDYELLAFKAEPTHPTE